MIESKTFTNPFPGLRPFATDEYRLFFGREGQSDAIITRLQRARFLAVVGASGSGKSSLVRAGLLPALRGGMMTEAGSGWRICIMRPGSDPFANLAHALSEKDVLLEAGGGLPPAEAEAVIAATLGRGSLGLVDAVRQARLAEGEKVLVLVDQFEELFRFRAARAATNTGDEASAFVKLMIEAAQQRELSIYVVLTMRSDFLGDCAQFQGLPEAINDGQYLIPRMTRDDRRMAIVGPVGVSRAKMAEPLINRLLNDVGDNPDQLPILQHALMRTWDYWAAHRRDGEPIGLEHYEAIGTMTEALSRHADEAWSELPDERSRLVAEKLFKSLTEKGADNREIRRPTRLSEIAAAAEATEAEVIATIDVFRREGRSFLMPPVDVKLSSGTVIDISHESLIRNWVRLQKWVEEEAQSARIYHRLAESAVLHREGKEGLLADPALQIAIEWREKEKPNRAWANHYHSEFDTAISFLDASRSSRDSQLRAEQQRLARQRKLRFALTLGLILVLALGGISSVVYYFKRAERRKNKTEADKAARQQLSTDSDARGDLYVELGKFDDAEPYYLQALAQREQDGDPVQLRKSWDKLTKLYRKMGPKDYPKAEKYNELLLDAYAVDPKSVQYADALVQRAALFVQESSYPEGESYYNRALQIYTDLHDWKDENLVIYRLTKLFEKQPNKRNEREQALKNRVDTLAGYFKQLTSQTDPVTQDSVYLVSEYLYALDTLAIFYKDSAAAEAVYEQALAASDYITSNIPSANNKNIPTRYAAMLGHYLDLIKSRNNPAEAEKVAQLEQVLAKLPKPPPVKTTAPQNVQTAQPSPTPETSPP